MRRFLLWGGFCSSLCFLLACSNTAVFDSLAQSEKTEDESSNMRSKSTTPEIVGKLVLQSLVDNDKQAFERLLAPWENVRHDAEQLEREGKRNNAPGTPEVRVKLWNLLWERRRAQALNDWGEAQAAAEKGGFRSETVEIRETSVRDGGFKDGLPKVDVQVKFKIDRRYYKLIVDDLILISKGGCIIDHLSIRKL